MENISLMIYLADVVGKVAIFFGLSGVIGLILVVVTAINEGFRSQDQEDDYRYGPLFIISALVMVGFIMTSTLIPSKQALYLIASANIAQEIAQTEAVQEIGSEALDLLRDSLKIVKEGIGGGE